MTTFILSFVVLLVVISAMAVGVIFANKPIKGTCGGMTALGIDSACDICGGDTKKCEDEQKKNGKLISPIDLAYDATAKQPK
ncbi:MAG: hypothetical protein ACI9Y1_000802 [Lentisphaeria bacterium]|jgi:hypothetical protein